MDSHCQRCCMNILDETLSHEFPFMVWATTVKAASMPACQIQVAICCVNLRSHFSHRLVRKSIRYSKTPGCASAKYTRRRKLIPNSVASCGNNYWTEGRFDGGNWLKRPEFMPLKNGFNHSIKKSSALNGIVDSTV